MIAVIYIISTIMNIIAQNYFPSIFKIVTTVNLGMHPFVFQLSDIIVYLLNIVLIYFLYNDMKKEKILNIPILILTFFDSVLGVIFFFVLIAYKKLIIRNVMI